MILTNKLYTLKVIYNHWNYPSLTGQLLLPYHSTVILAVKMAVLQWEIKKNFSLVFFSWQLLFHILFFVLFLFLKNSAFGKWIVDWFSWLFGGFLLLLIFGCVCVCVFCCSSLAKWINMDAILTVFSKCRHLVLKGYMIFIMHYFSSRTTAESREMEALLLLYEIPLPVSQGVWFSGEIREVRLMVGRSDLKGPTQIILCFYDLYAI